MGFFSGLVKVAAPVLGGMFGGPLGAAAGGALSGMMGGDEAQQASWSGIGRDLGTAAGGAWQNFSSAQRVAEGQEATNAMNKEMFDRQLGFNREQADINRGFQSYEADKARDWQANMSNTQYQRAVGDMEAAGLNPMLAYSQGGAGNMSSPSPSGSTASAPGAPVMVAPQAASAGALVQGSNTLADTQLKLAQVEGTNQQANASAASAAKIRAETFNVLQQWHVLDNEIKEGVNRIENQEVARRLLKAQADLQENAAALKAGDLRIQQEFARQMAQIEYDLKNYKAQEALRDQPRQEAEKAFYEKYGKLPFEINMGANAAGAVGNILGGAGKAVGGILKGLK